MKLDELPWRPSGEVREHARTRLSPSVTLEVWRGPDGRYSIHVLRRGRDDQKWASLDSVAAQCAIDNIVRQYTWLGWIKRKISG